VEEAAFRGGGVERPELAEICLGVYRVPNPEIPPGAARP